MKKLILDYSKWRCGDDSENKAGEGTTLLLNIEGFMCCLGQFSLQLNSELEENELLNEGEPGDLHKEITLLSSEHEEERFCSSGLSIAAIDINDCKITTPEKKIELLKELFAKYDCEIEVINKPISTNDETTIEL